MLVIRLHIEKHWGLLFVNFRVSSFGTPRSKAAIRAKQRSLDSPLHCLLVTLVSLYFIRLYQLPSWNLLCRRSLSVSAHLLNGLRSTARALSGVVNIGQHTGRGL